MGATAFQLRIVTPTRLVVDERVQEVTAPGTMGEFGVLPDHITFLTSLEVGTLSYRNGHATHKLAVRGGFAEVVNNVMTVLADDAAVAEEIDPAGARRDLQNAETELRDLSPVDEGFLAADVNRRWACTRLEVAGAELRPA